MSLVLKLRELTVKFEQASGIDPRKADYCYYTDKTTKDALIAEMNAGPMIQPIGNASPSFAECVLFDGIPVLIGEHAPPGTVHLMSRFDYERNLAQSFEREGDA